MYRSNLTERPDVVVPFQRKTTALTTERFIGLCRAAHTVEYDYSRVDYQGGHNYITIGCPTHGFFEQVARYHRSGQGCSFCKWQKKTKTQEGFLAKCQTAHGDKFDYSQITYERRSQVLTLSCPQHGEFTVKAGPHMDGHGCLPCGLRARLSNLEDFLVRARATHGDTYDYSKTVYVNANVKATFICSLHGEFEQTPMGHLQGCGCPACALIGRTATAEERKQRLWVAHGDRYDFSKVSYENLASHIKVEVVCREHGSFFSSWGNLSVGRGCPRCHTPSVGEVRIAAFLDDAGISYKPQKRFDDLRGKRNIPLSFDFYLPDLNMLIEYDGAQHYDFRIFKLFSPNATLEQFDEMQMRDRRKTAYALDNGFRFLRIPHTEFQRLQQALEEAGVLPSLKAVG